MFVLAKAAVRWCPGKAVPVPPPAHGQPRFARAGWTPVAPPCLSPSVGALPALCLPPSQPRDGAQLGAVSSPSSRPWDAQRVSGSLEAPRWSGQSWLWARSGVFRAVSCRLTRASLASVPMSHPPRDGAPRRLVPYALPAVTRDVPRTPEEGPRSRQGLALPQAGLGPPQLPQSGSDASHWGWGDGGTGAVPSWGADPAEDRGHQV